MGRWLSGCPDGRFVAAHGGWWLEAEQLVAGGGWLVVGGRWPVHRVCPPRRLFVGAP